VTFSKQNDTYCCDAWAQFVWQQHGFGTRKSVYAPALTLRQVHSAEVVAAGCFADRERQGDALVSREPGTTIAVRTADCVPILLLDPVTQAVAAVHAGWRGTAASIATATVARLSAEFGSKPENLQAAIGPSIRACCYEVSSEVAAQFSATCVHNFPGRPPHVDLAQANCEQLKAAGLSNDSIFDSHLCTFCLAEEFFSYRREPANPGRMLSFIMRTA